MMNRIVIVKLSILFGLLLALTKGVDPNVITASYPIIMEVGRTLDILNAVSLWGSTPRQIDVISSITYT